MKYRYKDTSANRGNNYAIRLHSTEIFLKIIQVFCVFINLIMKTNITVWDSCLCGVKQSPNVMLSSLRKHINSSGHLNSIWISELWQALHAFVRF